MDITSPQIEIFMKIFLGHDTRTYLKNRILVFIRLRRTRIKAEKHRGGAEFQPADILKYFEDLNQGPNAEVGPKDIFEIASNYTPTHSILTW